ncbi:MAG: hypothetical protein AB202_01920 [Parcubacteria bacterium C7867-007]|nr:MAG: hypothetical protein AB202_01920 [Parcubacteria bacterium C7867-007]
MVLTGIILALAVAFTAAGFIIYLADLRKDSNKPNRWSWLIWSVSAWVEALTYQAENTDWIKSSVLFISAVACMYIARAIWKGGKWETPDITEGFSVVASLVALVLWLYYGETLWAHIMMVVALPIAFLPTWQKAWKDPACEDSHAWWVWTVGDCFTLALVFTNYESPTELPYMVMELVCHAAVWGVIARKNIARVVARI